MQIKSIFAFSLMTVFLSACVTVGEHDLSVHFNEPDISAELFTDDGQIVIPNTFKIENPEDKIVILHNHGKSAGRGVQPCGPSLFPRALDAMRKLLMKDTDIVFFNLCSYSVHQRGIGRLTALRAREIELAVRLLKDSGIQERNILVSGTSWGGWSSLEYYATYKPSIMGLILFAPGEHCRNRKPHWDGFATAQHKKRHAEITAKFKATRIDGLLFSHPKDYCVPTDPYQSFARDVKGLRLVKEVHCQYITDGIEAHGFPGNVCSVPYMGDIKAFIREKLQSRR